MQATPLKRLATHPVAIAPAEDRGPQRFPRKIFQAMLYRSMSKSHSAKPCHLEAAGFSHAPVVTLLPASRDVDSIVGDNLLKVSPLRHFPELASCFGGELGDLPQ
jgi:hypothetical protein